MTTYIIQYGTNPFWDNVIAEDGTTIEFVFKSHAISIARILRNLPAYKHDNFRIRDSHGNAMDI